MINKLKYNFQVFNTDLGIIYKKIIYIMLSILIFRIGSFIPIPGIDTTIFSTLLYKNSGTILEMFNMFSGGALSQASIFSLGIMPYISSSIIIQLLTLIIPKLSELKKEGDLGGKKINQYTRFLTLMLAIVQSIGIVIGLPNLPNIGDLIITTDFYFYFTAIFSLITGTIFLMWLGELITEYGIGNGTSIIIFIGIISNIPHVIFKTIRQINQYSLCYLLFLSIICLIYIITYIVVFIEKSQRKIEVYYGKRQQGRKLYAVQNTHLPLKVNMAGVMPAIFASSIMLFPTTLLTLFGKMHNQNMLLLTLKFLQPNTLIYNIIYSILIVFFCFFYTGLVFNARDTANNLKKSGAFIPGIRPGEQTSRYINKITLRLTTIGSLYIVFICIVPELMRLLLKVSFYFGGTSLLIVVVVIIDFISHIQTLVLSNKYGSILKKSKLNFKK